MSAADAVGRYTLVAAVLCPAVALADAPPVQSPTAWSSPTRGLALGLVVGGQLRESADPDHDHAATLRVHVFVKNTTGRRARIRVPPLPQGLTVAIEQRGTRMRFGPTFYPPPMPRPGDRPRPRTLAPGASLLYASIDSVSGFTETARPGSRWYRALPAGRYELWVWGTIGGVKGRFTSRRVPLRVERADLPVGGLKLAVRADRLRTRVRADGRDIEPIRLQLTFRNVGARPLGLDLDALNRRGLSLDVSGPSTSRVAAPPAQPGRRSGRPVLKPGQALQVGRWLPFPGDFGGKIYRITTPGWYQLRLRYEQQGKTRCGSTRCWTGQVSANLLWLEVLPSK